MEWNRHAVQLLTPASIVAKTNGREQISKVFLPFCFTHDASVILGLS